MNLKLSFFALLVIFSSMANTKSVIKDQLWGCGDNGDCWTSCDEGKGWCYTGQSCTDKKQWYSGECNSALECKLPRRCNYNW